VKSWQLRHRLNGKEQTATLGKLDRIPLAEARKRAEELRKVKDEGQHLTPYKRIQKASKAAESEMTFARFSAAWLKREGRRAGWSADYEDEVAASLKNHLSDLDELPMAAINAVKVAPLLHKLELHSHDMLVKVRRRLRPSWTTRLNKSFPEIPSPPHVAARGKVNGGITPP